MSQAQVVLPEPVRRVAETRAADGGFASVDDYVARLIEADAAVLVSAALEADLLTGLDGVGVDATAIDWSQKRRALVAEHDGSGQP